MAIAVLNCHAKVLFPVLVETSIWKAFLYTPFSMFVSGGFGVSYFFVLSSFGLWLNNYEKDWRLIVAGYVKRYFRLIPTLVMSDFVAFVLIRNGFYYLTPGYFDDTGMIKFNIFMSNSRTVLGMLKDSMWDVFVYGKSNYVAPFWTMKLEMLGGIIAIGILFIIRNRTYKYKIITLLFAGLIIAFYGNGYYYSTLAGIILYETLGYISLRKMHRRKKYSKYWFCVTLMIFWMIVMWAVMPMNQKVNYANLCGIAWALLMAYLFFDQNSIMCKFLESSPLKILGKLSFQIYGLHWGIICSIGCFLVNRGYDIQIGGGIMIYLIVVAVTIILAYAIWQINDVIQRNLIDRMFAHLGKNIGRRINNYAEQ